MEYLGRRRKGAAIENRGAALLGPGGAVTAAVGRSRYGRRRKFKLEAL